MMASRGAGRVLLVAPCTRNLSRIRTAISAELTHDARPVETRMDAIHHADDMADKIYPCGGKDMRSLGLALFDHTTETTQEVIAEMSRWRERESASEGIVATSIREVLSRTATGE